MFHTLIDKVEIIDCGQLKSKLQEFEDAEKAKYAAPPMPKPRSEEELAAELPPPPKPTPPPPKPKPPPPKPTEEDLAIVSAEIDDDFD